MWTVLFYVNPLTITLALALALVAALFLARRRPAVRAVTLCLATLYLLILAAPLVAWARSADRIATSSGIHGCPSRTSVSRKGPKISE